MHYQVVAYVIHIKWNKYIVISCCLGMPNDSLNINFYCKMDEYIYYVCLNKYLYSNYNLIILLYYMKKL